MISGHRRGRGRPTAHQRGRPTGCAIRSSRPGRAGGQPPRSTTPPFASEPSWPPRSPALWLGQLAILFLGLHPGWFPVGGRTNPRSHYRGLEAHPRRCGPPRPSCPRGPRIRPPHTRAAGSALAVGRRRPSVSRRSRTSPIGATATLLPATSAASRPTTSNSGTRSTEKERANIGLEGRMTKLAQRHFLDLTNALPS